MEIMPWQPILSSLRHHRMTAILLTLQVAFTCAIVCNAAFLIAQRVQRISVVSGVDEESLSIVQMSDPNAIANPLSLHQADLDALRRLPGVLSAAIISNVPLSGDQNSSGACGSMDAIHAAMAAHSTQVPACANPDDYEVGSDALASLGLTLVAGRDFRADEYVAGQSGHVVASVPAAIVSDDLAKRLFPGGNAVGQSVYFGASGFKGHGTPVVGVVAHLSRGNLIKDTDNDEGMLLPVTPNDAAVRFALRSRPRDRTRVLKAAEALLASRVPGRQVSASSGTTYTQIRSDYFQRDSTMINLLLASASGLLFVTALGIAGLASFWVQQRTRSIGIRRAIGATRGDIVRYFQTENFLIVGGGIVLGVLLALILNRLLMVHYELPPLPLYYLPIGALLLWSLGQLAVLGPALHAAAVPPVVATRSL
jgi:putative ABC transport system permease protein